MQVTRTFKLGVASLLVAAAWPASAGLVTTINTSALEANARLDFSTDAVQAMNGVGISRTALGTTKAIGTGGVSFNMPVTSATTDLNLLPPSLTAVAGSSMGAALGLTSGSNSLILGNFNLDFKNKVVKADAWSNGVKSSLNVYTFNIAQGLTLSTTGGLSLHEVIDHLTLTSAAADTFASALNISPILKPALTMLNYGSITIDIKPALRSRGPVSGKAYTPPPVPEPSTYALMGLGLVAAAYVARRKAA